MQDVSASLEISIELKDECYISMHYLPENNFIFPISFLLKEKQIYSYGTE